MVLPIRLLCEARKARKDGTSIVYLEYNFSRNKHPLLNTGISIPVSAWNAKKQQVGKSLPPGADDPVTINAELKRQYRLLEDLVDLLDQKGVEDKGSFVAEVFRPDLDLHLLANNPTIWSSALPEQKRKSDPADVYDQLEDYIESKTGLVSDSTIRIYQSVGFHLKQFEAFRGESITFKSFDPIFYNRFVHFLTYDYVHERSKKKLKGLRKNSIAKTIKQLRQFLNDRIDNKIIASIDLRSYKSQEEETDAIYLTVSEISQVYHCELSKYPYLIPDKNRLVLACLTGLRFSDFSRLKPTDIRNNSLFIRQEKTEGRVVIPLRKECNDILTELFASEIPLTSNPEFNKNIKIIGKLAGIDEMVTFAHKKGNKTIEVTKAKCDWITSHIGRRSFCTNEFLAGTPVKLIMKISGHKKEKDFYKYIRITPEEAAEIIQRLWEARNGMEALRLTKDLSIKRSNEIAI